MISLVTEISDQQLRWRNDPSVFLTCRQNELLWEYESHKWWDGLKCDHTRKFFGLEVSEGSGIPGFKKKPFLVGTAGLSGISTIYKHAEYSLLIGPEYWGKGYATEALIALLRYGFENLNLHRIWGEIIDNNGASIHIAKKVGMIEEGLHRDTYFKGGKWCNSYTYSILQEEFFKQHGRSSEVTNS